MAITRKPSRESGPEVDVAALINRGGAPAGKQAAEEPPTATAILLRIPAGLMERLDAVLKGRPVRIPRHTWILEAIHEKLTREGGAPE